jgi:hypothetical protein
MFDLGSRWHSPLRLTYSSISCVTNNDHLGSSPTSKQLGGYCPCIIQRKHLYFDLNLFWNISRFVVDREFSKDYEKYNWQSVVGVNSFRHSGLLGSIITPSYTQEWVCLSLRSSEGFPNIITNRLMCQHKALSCCIRSGYFLHRVINNDTECSHLYQIWPEEDSSVEWSSRKRHSATVQY